MAAAILHDCGRAREFTYGAEFGLSEEGRMLGHLAIGAQIVGAAAAPLPEPRRLALLNCVLSHHGPDAGPGRARGARAASPRPRRWPSTASMRSTPRSRARSSTLHGPEPGTEEPREVASARIWASSRPRY